MLFLQPTMFLPMVAGYAMGARIGFFVGAMTPLVSNFFMGQGPWTPWQMLCWGLLGASGALIGYLRPGWRAVCLTIACCAAGYLYGAVMDVWQWATYTNPLTWRSYLVLWAAGFSFDSLRALGNFFFCGLLGAQAMKILAYYQKKLTVQYLERLD
jgi:energy-coupling factor transport system substrate-specific component